MAVESFLAVPHTQTMQAMTMHITVKEGLPVEREDQSPPTPFPLGAASTSWLGLSAASQVNDPGAASVAADAGQHYRQGDVQRRQT